MVTNLAAVRGTLVVILIVSLSWPAAMRARERGSGWNATSSPGNGLRIVGPGGETTPVVNERGRLALRVLDASGSPVAVQRWTSDNASVGKVSRRGMLRGRTTGFATVRAETALGVVSGFVVVARVSQQTGAKVQGDTKTDTSGNVYLSSPQRHAIYRAAGLSAEVFAGALDQSGYAEGQGGGIRFDGPAGLGVDNRAEGGLYVADTINDCIRKVDFRGRSSLAVGTPQVPGTMYADETPMAEAVLSGPRGVATVGSSLFVTDTDNDCVWYVDTQRGRVQLLAGQPGEAGLANGVGRSARFDHPSGIAINTRGNLLAVADTGNNVIRLVGLAPRPNDNGLVGEVTTLGLSSSARGAKIAEAYAIDRGEDQIGFDGPESVSFDGVDNVYVIDRQSASVVTRGKDFVEREDLAQVGTLGDPASVTVRRTQTYVLDESAQTEQDAVKLVEVGAPTITALSENADRIEGGKAVTITGTNFARESRLILGDAEVTEYSVDRSTQITFTVPRQQLPGARTLTILTRGGTAQTPFFIVAKPLAELRPGEITTVAGGVPYIGDGGAPKLARVQPIGLSLDSAGALVVADTIDNRVRRIGGALDTITTIAGNGRDAYSGDGGNAAAASLAQPFDVQVDASGNVLVADSQNNRIRKIDRSTGRIETIAGGGPNDLDESDGVPALQYAIVFPQALTSDSAGNVFVCFENRVVRIDTRTGLVHRVAGRLEAGSAGDGGPAVDALLRRPTGMVLDSDESHLYIADTDNNRIRVVDLASHTIATLAGTGVDGFSGDGGNAAAAELSKPRGLAIDPAGNLDFCDSGNNRIRRVDLETGTIRTALGGGRITEGDNLPAEQVFVSPYDVIVDGAGALVYSEIGRIRRFDPTTNRVTIVAGGTTFRYDVSDGVASHSTLFGPIAVTVAQDGRVLVGDYSGAVLAVEPARDSVRLIAGGSENIHGDGGSARDSAIGGPFGLSALAGGDVVVSSFGFASVFRISPDANTIRRIAGVLGESGFGGDGGQARDAHLAGPFGVAVDPAGNIFVADSENNRIRRIAGATGVITTIAGNGAAGFGGDGGPAVNASLYRPEGVAVGGDGAVYVADRLNNRVRRIDPVTGAITTVAGTGEGGFDGDGGPAVDARLLDPSGLAVDSNGNVFVADLNNRRVRRIDAGTGVISTVAGMGGEFDYSGDGGDARAAFLGGPYAVAIDADGNLYVADFSNSAVRVVKAAAAQRR